MRGIENERERLCISWSPAMGARGDRSIDGMHGGRRVRAFRWGPSKKSGVSIEICENEARNTTGRVNWFVVELSRHCKRYVRCRSLGRCRVDAKLECGGRTRVRKKGRNGNDTGFGCGFCAAEGRCDSCGCEMSKRRSGKGMKAVCKRVKAGG